MGNKVKTIPSEGPLQKPTIILCPYGMLQAIVEFESTLQGHEACDLTVSPYRNWVVRVAATTRSVRVARLRPPIPNHRLRRSRLRGELSGLQREAAMPLRAPAEFANSVLSGGPAGRAKLICAQRQHSFEIAQV